MLDRERLGVKLALLRKDSGYSQEKLADMLCISPQAISRWENGRTMPETSLLPVLAQIFGCTIDEIIMPAYTFDEKIEREKINTMERQAEHIADRIIQKMEEKTMHKEIVGLDDDAIIASIHSAHSNVGNCEVIPGNPTKTGRYTSVSVTVRAPQAEYKLIEKIYAKKDMELQNYSFVKDYTVAIPLIYHIDPDRRIILMEDLSGEYVQGFHFNEDNESGAFIRENHEAILCAAAKFHAAFWENFNAFGQIGLDWRLENRENLLAHINGMEKDFKKYRENEKIGKIPKVWNTLENHIELGKLGMFETAIDMLRERYVELLDTRFNTGKNITVIHGDLHPGNTFVSKAPDRAVKFIDMQALRMGLCTEDLAMLLALHIEPDKKHALALLEFYYRCLCESVNGYPFETFLNDYEISVMESMFFTLRHINHGIYDFSMRDRAMRAFETFVLEK